MRLLAAADTCVLAPDTVSIAVIARPGAAEDPIAARCVHAVLRQRRGIARTGALRLVGALTLRGGIFGPGELVIDASLGTLGELREVWAVLQLVGGARTDVTVSPATAGETRAIVGLHAELRGVRLGRSALACERIILR